MPKTTTKPKAGTSKRGASKSASRKATKKVANKTLGKKTAKKAAGKTPGKKAARKVGNGLAPARKRGGKRLLNPQPLTPREEARLVRAFQMAYENHQKRLAEMADQLQEDSQ